MPLRPRPKNDPLKEILSSETPKPSELKTSPISSPIPITDPNIKSPTPIAAISTYTPGMEISVPMTGPTGNELPDDPDELYFDPTVPSTVFAEYSDVPQVPFIDRQPDPYAAEFSTKYIEEDLARPRREASSKSEIKISPDSKSELERQKLMSNIANKGKIMNVKAQIESGIVRPEYAPEEEWAERIWVLAYEAGIATLFSKGLAFYNSNPKQLKEGLQLAVIRADEAVEAFVAVRKVSPNPIKKELQTWQRNKSTNPLANPSINSNKD